MPIYTHIHFPWETNMVEFLRGVSKITYGYVWKFDASEMRRLAHFFPLCFYVDPENCHKMGDVNPQLW